MTQSNYTLLVRAWCHNSDMWDLFWDFNGRASDFFVRAGFPHPYEKVELRDRTRRSEEGGASD